MSYRALILATTLLLSFGQEAYAAKRRKAMASKVNDRKDRRKINKQNKVKDKCSERFSRFLVNETSVYSNPFSEVLEELSISKDKVSKPENHDLIQSHVTRESFNLKGDFFARTLAEMKDHEISFSSNNLEKIKQTAYLAIENSTAKEFSTVLHGVVKYFGNDLDEYIVEVLKDKIIRNLQNSTVVELNTFLNSFRVYDLKFSDDQLESILNQLTNHLENSEFEREKVVNGLRIISNMNISKGNAQLLSNLIEQLSNYPIQDYPENVLRYLHVSKRHFPLVKTNFIQKIVGTDSFVELLEANEEIYKMLLKSILFIKEKIDLSPKVKEVLKRRMNESALDSTLVEQNEIAKSVFRLDTEGQSDLSRILNIQNKTYSKEEERQINKIILNAKGQVLNSLVEIYWSPKSLPPAFLESYLKAVRQNIDSLTRAKNVVFSVLSLIKEGQNDTQLAEETFLTIKKFSTDKRRSINDNLIELLRTLKFSDKTKSAHEVVNFFYDDIDTFSISEIEKLVHYIDDNSILVSNDKIDKISDIISKNAQEIEPKKLSKLTYIISMMNQDASSKLVNSTYEIIKNNLNDLDAMSLGVYLSSIKYSCPRCVVEIWNKVNWSQLLGNKKASKEMHPIFSTLRYMEGIEKIELSNKGLFKDVLNDELYFDRNLEQEISRLQLSVESFIKKNTKHSIIREFYDKDLVTHIDIFIPAKKVAIEVDGPIHYLTDEKGRLVPRVKDTLKDQALEKKGIRVIHIPYYKWDRGYKSELKRILDSL